MRSCLSPLARHVRRVRILVAPRLQSCGNLAAIFTHLHARNLDLCGFLGHLSDQEVSSNP
jgi:hypothetical protein